MGWGAELGAVREHPVWGLLGNGLLVHRGPGLPKPIRDSQASNVTQQPSSYGPSGLGHPAVGRRSVTPGAFPTL